HQLGHARRRPAVGPRGLRPAARVVVRARVGRRRAAAGGGRRMTDRTAPESLTVVLPAFNEAERIGPALDELFGYLRRRGDEAPDGAPGSGHLPPRVDVLVVDDGSTDGTADLVRARPEASPEAADGGAPLLAVLTVPHGGKGAAVRAGMLHARSDL